MCATPDRPAEILKPTETVMKLTINWTKLAESLAPLNPYGPFFASDGSIYGCDGRLLVGPRDGSAAPAVGHTVTEPAAARTARAPIGQPAFA
jgi:hypothetical protein